jgi:LacI family transcriptional regulator
MTNKVTIYDIAEKLGISVGTVNRAMHDKPRVSRETRELVLKTAEEMGFRTNKVARSLSGKAMKIGFIFEASPHIYADEVANGVRFALGELEDYKVSGDIYITRDSLQLKRQELEEKINQYIREQYDGIILCTLPAALTSSTEDMLRNYPSWITVSSDLPHLPRLFSVRPNGKVVGKMAAELLGWLVGNKPVAIFTGNKEVQIHRETIDGFMEENKNQDDPEIAYYATGKLLKDCPEVGGIYVNSSNSATVCKKLRELELDQKIMLVTTDIFPELKNYIAEGMVQATIFQDPFTQGRQAVKCLYRHISGEEKQEGNILIKPQVIMRSNLELFL